MRSRITSQSVLTLVVSLVTIVIIALFFIQVQYSVNERAIRSLAGGNIQVISRIIQFSIDEINAISLEILTDNGIQNYDSSPAESRLMKVQVQNTADLFGSYQIFNPYIETFFIRFENGASFSKGKVQDFFSDNYVRYHEQELKNANGKMVITSYPGDSGRFIVGREIRKIKNLDQSHIAYLFMVIDIEKLFDIYFRKYGVQDIWLLLLQDDRMMYSYNNRISTDIMDEVTKKKPGVYRFNGANFFLHGGDISDARWRVYILLPFSGIVKSRNLLTYGSFVVLIFGLMGLIFWGRSWSRRITHPIIALADKMEELQSNDFSDRNPELPEYNRSNDEIAILYDNFNRLFRKVDTLIHENYKKQLLLKETQLRNLITQINPHFIYNTLDTISWMALDTDSPKIADMVQSLSILLRASVYSENIIPLEQEIDLARRYLEIQKIRFEERLDFMFTFDGDIQEFSVPSMILQPIVENSIKYSLDIPKSTVSISIRIEYCEDRVQLTISDDGPGISKDRMQTIFHNGRTESIGLGNIFDRLAIFYGEDAQILLDSELGEGTVVILRIPPQAGKGDEKDV